MRVHFEFSSGTLQSVLKLYGECVDTQIEKKTHSFAW